MKTNIFKKLFIIVGLLGVLAPGQLLAAEVLFQPQTIATPHLKDYTVTVVLNTNGESINAIEGQVLVDPKLGKIKQVIDTGSIVTFWVERPTVQNNSEVLKFSGTIPGGYSGGAGILFSLVLPGYEGEQIKDAIKIIDLKALRNDGLGSNVSIDVKNFSISETNGLTSEDILSQLYLDGQPDNVPPEVFSPQVARDDRVFDGQWFLNFSTVDKQSGVDFYEVQESKSGRIEAGKWTKAESPYLLTDQKLNSFIYVTAVDRSGNERIIKVFPRNPIPVWKKWWPALIILGFLLTVTIVGYSRSRKPLVQ